VLKLILGKDMINQVKEINLKKEKNIIIIFKKVKKLMIILMIILMKELKIIKEKDIPYFSKFSK
jgi:hypothetical protein